MVGAGYGALLQVGQIPERSAHHHAGTCVRKAVNTLFDLRWGKHAMANKPRNKTCSRAVVQGVRIVPLVQLAAFHHTNPVTNRKRFELVMRDKKGSGLSRFQNTSDLVGQALTQVHVKVRKRLVQQQQARAGCQRPGQCHTLLLAARQLVRKALAYVGQSDQL